MKKTKIYYFYDALCGWCFGFSPVIQRIYKEYHNEFDFEIVSGGMKLGADVGPIGVVAPYIKAGAYKQVEQTCNVKFGDDFVCGPLEEGTIVLDSLKPAIALSIVKTQKPESAFVFSDLLHRALYVDGDDIGELSNYSKYAVEIGLDSFAFIRDMENPSFNELAERDFAFTKSLGINGFPTMVAEKEESAFLISRGFTSYQDLVNQLNLI